MKPDLEIQTSFGDNGNVEEPEEVDTNFKDWGVEIEEPRLEKRYLEEKASEFGIDDRSIARKSNPGDQETLFISFDDGQMDLVGNEVSMDTKW